MAKISTPIIGEVLKEEFMKPLQISAYKLAKLIGVPTSRIQNILHDRIGITVDTTIRLGRIFGVSDKYFLNLQEDIDFRNAKTKKVKRTIKLKSINLFSRVCHEVDIFTKLCFKEGKIKLIWRNLLAMMLIFIRLTSF